MFSVSDLDDDSTYVITPFESSLREKKMHLIRKYKKIFYLQTLLLGHVQSAKLIVWERSFNPSRNNVVLTSQCRHDLAAISKL